MNVIVNLKNLTITKFVSWTISNYLADIRITSSFQYF